MTKHALHVGLAATALLFACSITHRSGDYACTMNSDCDSSRVCSQGFCVVPNGATVDAPGGGSGSGSGVFHDAPPRPDAPNNNGCPPGCSSCDTGTKTCNIECGSPGAANCNNGQVTCPAGWSCNIDCKTNQACTHGVSCTDATACTITCSGAGACKNVECGDGPCDVKCIGTNSCQQNVSCNGSCMCDIVCSGPGDNTCASGISCGTFACFDQLAGAGCRSQPANFCQGTCQ